MEYQDLIKEIEHLKQKYGLSAQQLLLLQIAASFESNQMSYESLKEEIIGKQKKVTKYWRDFE